MLLIRLLGVLKVFRERRFIWEFELSDSVSSRSLVLLEVEERGTVNSLTIPWETESEALSQPARPKNSESWESNSTGNKD